MSDMGISSRGSNADARQLDDLKQENEKKLDATRSDFKRREVETRDAGDAAVNHIKKNNEERVDQVRTDGNTRLKNTNAEVTKDYSDLKRRAVQQDETLTKQKIDEADRAKKNIETVKQSENKTIRESQAQLRTYLDQQQELKEQARERTNAEIKDSEARGSKQMTESQKSVGERTREVEQKHKKELDGLKSRSQAVYNQTREQAERQLHELKRQNQVKYKEEQEQDAKDINQVHGHFTEVVKSEQREGEHKLTAQQKDEQKKFEQDREHVLRTNEKVQAEYSSETHRVESEGERQIRETQAKFDSSLKEQKTANRKQLKETETAATSEEYKARKEHEGHIEQDAKKLDETWREKQDDFKRKFSTDEKMFKASLDNQKEVYLKELYKQKSKMDQRSGVETAREHDPFYNLKSFDAKLAENSDSYILRGRVAPYDKDSVQVKVLGDKISLSAKRSYEDSFAAEGAKTTTNSYQTYRQEFQFGAPVLIDKAVTSIKDDGSIEVIIPKKNLAPKV